MTTRARSETLECASSRDSAATGFERSPTTPVDFALECYANSSFAPNRRQFQCMYPDREPKQNLCNMAVFEVQPNRRVR
jgi:hypothetical protein